MSAARKTGLGFTVPGVPVSKLRHRSVSGRRPYTPGKTTKHEKLIGYYGRYAMGVADIEPFEGPVELQCVFCMPIAKSWTKEKKRQARQAILLPTTKPDLGNLIKCVEDALNKVMYQDDKQVVACQAAAIYSDNPRTIIYVRPFKGWMLKEGQVAPAAFDPVIFKGTDNE